jgi:uncharacterized protein (DUF1697 family)
MAELKVCFESLGYQNVKTYINSGNVLFTSPQTDPHKLESAIENALSKAFGRPIMAVVRSQQQINDLLNHLPTSWAANPNQKFNIIFLHRSVDSPNILKQLSPKPGIEELHYHPGTILWSANQGMLTRSNMLKLSALPIYQQMTARSPNTVRKMQQLMKTASES